MHHPHGNDHHQSNLTTLLMFTWPQWHILNPLSHEITDVITILLTEHSNADGTITTGN